MAKATATVQGSSTRKTPDPKAPMADTAATNGEANEAAVNGHQPGRRHMSDTHKVALALGRDEGRAIRDYLEAIDYKPRRGPRTTPESSQRKLELIERQLSGSLDPLARLLLTQKKIDMLAVIGNTVDPGLDLAELEERFIQAAPGYSRRKGLTWAAWRQAGVPASVLLRAGITRN